MPGIKRFVFLFLIYVFIPFLIYVCKDNFHAILYLLAFLFPYLFIFYFTFLQLIDINLALIWDRIPSLRSSTNPKYFPKLL